MEVRVKKKRLTEEPIDLAPMDLRIVGG